MASFLVAMFNAPVIPKASFIRVPWWKTWYRSHSSLIRFPLRFESIWIWMTRPLFVDSIPLQSRGWSNHVKSTIHNRLVSMVSELFPIDRGLSPLLTVDKLTGTDATEAAEYFATLLLLLGKLRCTVSVVAHSLGCRVALTALTALTAKPAASGAGDVPQLEHVQVQQLGVKKNGGIELCWFLQWDISWQRWIVLFRDVKTQDWNHSWYTAAGVPLNWDLPVTLSHQVDPVDDSSSFISSTSSDLRPLLLISLGRQTFSSLDSHAARCP